MAGPDLPAHLDPVAVGQPHVQHRHVRVHRRDPAQGLVGRPRLAHDHHVVAGGLQQLADTSPDHLVVVEQEHPDRHPDLAPPGRWRQVSSSIMPHAVVIILVPTVP